MALITNKRPKWTFVQSVHFRIFVLIFGVLVLFCTVLLHYMNQVSANYIESQRTAETTRYCNLLAGELSFQSSEENQESTLRNTFRSLNSYMRVLILDRNCLVVEDTTQSLTGFYVINQETLTCLNGETVSNESEDVFRVAVPIWNVESNQVTGVVYGFADMSEIKQSVRAGQHNLVLFMFGVGLLAALADYWIVKLGTRPLGRILEWLHVFKTPERELKRPLFRHKTEYRDMVEAVDEATGDLLLLDQSRREFVSNVSHELKTPLSSIKVLTESLLLQNGLPEDIYREFLGDIESEIDRMNQIINDLLTLVRLEEGQKVLNLSVIRMHDMGELICHRLTPLAEERGITIRMEADPSLEIEADETKLTLAITNLVQNAIKYNKENGSVTLSVFRSGRNAVIRVSDTGIGIEPDHYEKLFERFYRVDKARDRETGGSGLGLSIVKRIVDLHGGTVHVESKPGEGSVFTIILPVEQAADLEDDV